MNDITIGVKFGGVIQLLLSHPPPEGDCIVSTSFAQFTCKAKGKHMAYTLPVGKLVVVRVDYVDAGGNPALVDGAVTWASSDDQIATAVVDAQDSHLCTISAVDAVGLAQITATADADLGSGTRHVITTLDLDAVAGEAVAGSITPTNEAQPIAPHPEGQAAA